MLFLYQMLLTTDLVQIRKELTSFLGTVGANLPRIVDSFLENQRFGNDRPMFYRVVNIHNLRAILLIISVNNI